MRVRLETPKILFTVLKPVFSSEIKRSSLRCQPMFIPPVRLLQGLNLLIEEIADGEGKEYALLEKLFLSNKIG